MRKRKNKIPTLTASEQALEDLREALPSVSQKALVRSMVDELATWHEGWEQQHVLEFEVGLKELASRLGGNLPQARAYVINQAELDGVLL